MNMESNSQQTYGNEKDQCHDCGQIGNDIRELKQQNDDLKANQDRISEQVAQLNHKIQSQNDEMKALLTQINEMQGMLVQAFEQMKTNSDEVKAVTQEQLGQPTRELDTEQQKRKNDVIIVAGGFTPKEGPSCHVEIYSWEERSWSQLPDMNESRQEASTFVYQGKAFIAGGERGLMGRTDTIEVMNTDQEPFQWQMFPAKLPDPLYDHKTVVYNNKMITFGGWSTGQYSDSIHETLLVAPYSTKLLGKIPEPRGYHGAELVDNKVVILGGKKGLGDDDIVKSVYAYNIVENKCEEMAPLPYAVSGMATVVWRNKILVIGGEGIDGEILSKVLMYNVETGKIETLPSMKYKRRGCSAVATGHGVVVMGGRNNEDGSLNYVEYFDMSTCSWQELPPMIKCRSFACAFVKS